MPHLTWSAGALRDFSRVLRFLSAKSSTASQRASRVIYAGIRIIADRPELGRLTHELPPDYREWIIPFGKGAYVIFYRYTHTDVMLLGLRHSRELGYLRKDESR